MGWIKKRIIAELGKHERLGEDMWTKLAEAKIESEIYDRIDEWQKHNWYGDLNAQVSEDILNELKCMVTQSKPKKNR